MGTPFEYDLCQFRNVNERDPIYDNSTDSYTLLCIRRAIMDAFCIRETSTVFGNSMRLRRHYFDLVKVLSIRRPVTTIGTNKVRDIVCMRCALQTMNALRRKVKCHDHLQWNFMHINRTWYNNTRETGVGSSEAGAIYSSNDKNVYKSTSPMTRIWFSIFVLKKKRRIGVLRRKDEALTADQLLLIGNIYEKDSAKLNYEEEEKEL